MFRILSYVYHIQCSELFLPACEIIDSGTCKLYTAQTLHTHCTHHCTSYCYIHTHTLWLTHRDFSLLFSLSLSSLSLLFSLSSFLPFSLSGCRLLRAADDGEAPQQWRWPVERMGRRCRWRGWTVNRVGETHRSVEALRTCVRTCVRTCRTRVKRVK